jgi:hypothetical protein
VKVKYLLRNKTKARENLRGHWFTMANHKHQALQGQQVLNFVESKFQNKSSSRLNYEMMIRMVRFNVKDKRNVTMEGEIIFQDAKVEPCKVDDVIINYL